MKETIRIAGGQGFYGDSPMGAIAIAAAGATDYLVHDALSELTLSILQKDKLKDPNAGYPRDIEVHAKLLYPLAFNNNIKIVTNSGGLNPYAAANKVAEILRKQGIQGKKIAVVTGDDVFDRLTELQAGGESLAHLETGQAFEENKKTATHANVYVGASGISEALAMGADLILSGRVADPCLTLGILNHEFNWGLEQDPNPTQASLDRWASGIVVGHLLECGGQASGGNSYAEWPLNYKLSNLGYPIAEVHPEGNAVFSRLARAGGKMSRDTLREQLIYEIHNPTHYITPDVIVDMTHVTITQQESEKVEVKGAKGKPRPEKLKLCMGMIEGYLTDQFFFFSWPYAYEKAEKFVEAAKEIWQNLPIRIDRIQVDYVGVNGIHGPAARRLTEAEKADLNEIGVRFALAHQDPNAGKIAMQAIICLGLNGPPGVVAVPGWGNTARTQLALWPTLIDRKWITPKVEIIQV